MKAPFYGHERQYMNMKKDIDEAISRVLMSGKYVRGPEGDAFEKELAAFHGAKYAVGCNSGTDTLWLSMMALGVGEGDEVITTVNTFFATAEAIWIAGATAVFVDCDPKTRCIDVAKMEAAITPKTKCLMPVHLYGQMAEMDKISAIAKKHKLFVIEDNAQAIDAEGPGFKVGSLSDVASTSFIIQKNLGCFGDGGAIVTNNEALAKKVRKLAAHGSDARSKHSYGFNSRLDDIHAATLRIKLRHIHANSDKRIAIARKYDAGLKDCGLALPYTMPGYRHVFHLYVIDAPMGKRDAMIKWLNEQGVDAKCHYDIAIHQQEGYPWGKQARIVGPQTNSEYNAATCVSLPMFPELTDEEVKFTIEKVNEWCKANVKK